MKKWRCTVCGEIVESDVRPDKCPLCKAPGEKFVEVKEEEEKSEEAIVEEIKEKEHKGKKVKRIKKYTSEESYHFH